MIHVKYDHGAEPIPGDSGAPTGNGTTLLGLIKGVISYTVTDMIHVKYDHGADPLNGDSGAPTGNGPTLLGLVTDGGGDSSKARNMSDIYRTGHWIVPGH